MKITIRQGVFETNSSSTHTLTIVTKDLWNLFKAGKLLYDYTYEAILPIEELLNNSDHWVFNEIIKVNEGKLRWRHNESYDKAELIKLMREELKIYREHEVDGYTEWVTYEDFCCMDEPLAYIKPYTSKSGDEIVAFGNMHYEG